MNNGKTNSSRDSVKIKQDKLKDTVLPDILKNATIELEIQKAQQNNSLLYRIKNCGSWILIVAIFVITFLFISFIARFLFIVSGYQTCNYAQNTEIIKEMKTIIIAVSGWFIIIIDKSIKFIKKPNTQLYK